MPLSSLALFQMQHTEGELNVGGSGFHMELGKADHCGGRWEEARSGIGYQELKNLRLLLLCVLMIVLKF